LRKMISWFDRSEITGGSESIWDLFKKHFNFSLIYYGKAQAAMNLQFPYFKLGFPEVDGGMFIEEYYRSLEEIHVPSTLIINSMQLPFYKPKAKTICLVQDLHTHGALQLKEYYNIHEINRIAKVFNDFQRRSCYRADKVVFVSKFCKEMFIKYNPDIDGIVIEHGVDLDKFKPLNNETLRQDYKIPKDKPVGLWVGRFHPQKGWHIIRDLVHKRPDVHWILCFMGPVPKKETRLENVTIMNDVNSNLMPLIYNLADFFILPSYCESFGLSSLEACACGIPIITHNTGWVYGKTGINNFGIVLDTITTEKYSKAIDVVLGADFKPREEAEKYPISKWIKEWGELIEKVEKDSRTASK